MTIFMCTLPVYSTKRPRNSRRGSKALFVAAEHAIPVSGDDVVDAIEDRTWQNARHALPPSRATQADRRRRALLASGQCPAAIRSIVRHNVKRRQVVGVAAETFNHRPARVALQRSEREHAARRSCGEEELEQAAAQPADTVVEHEVNAFGVGGGLRMVNQPCSNINEHVH